MRVHNKVILFFFAVFMMFSVISMVSRSVSAGLNDGLVAHYPFNGNADDESGNGNHGIVNGATLTSDSLGNIESAYSFDGVDDFINAGSGTIVDNITIKAVSFWIMPTTFDYSIISKFAADGNQWALSIDSSGILHYEHGWTTASWTVGMWKGDTALQIGEWSYVTVNYDTSSNLNDPEIYINGVSVNVTEISPGHSGTSGDDGAGDLLIAPNLGTKHLNGTLDDIRIYNRVLLTSEITQLFTDTGVPGTTGGPGPETGETVVEGKVYCDTDLDGQISANDVLLTDVEVRVTDPSGDSATGTYGPWDPACDCNLRIVLPDAEIGTFTVDIVSPVGQQIIIGDSFTTTTVGEGRGPYLILLDGTFCQEQTIGDFVWCDDDNNGLHEQGELGIPDVEVNLSCMASDGVLYEAQETTGGDGMYLFTGVPANYSCTVTVDPSTAPVDKVPGDHCDQTHVIPLIELGQDYLDADFCFRPIGGVIGDLVWCDRNNDGEPDIDEPGIEGVMITLKCAGLDEQMGTVDDIIVQTTTDEKGEYLFTDVPAGLCFVTVDPLTVPDDCNIPGECQNQYEVDLGVGQSFMEANFCFSSPGEIGDFVWCDRNNDGIQDDGEPGIMGVVVNLSCLPNDGGPEITAQTTTDGDGMYLFTEVPAGICDVTVDPSSVPDDCNVPGARCEGAHDDIDLGAGESYLLADICFTPLCGDCDGKVTELTLQYNGLDGKNVTVKQKKPERVIFNGLLNSGDQFDVIIENDNDGNLKNTEIYLFTGKCLKATIHTSCSRPIGPGLISGPFEVISGVSRNGGILCPADNGGGDDDSDSSDDDCCSGKVTYLTLQNGGPSGFIMVTQKNDVVVFAGDVETFDPDGADGAFTFIGSDKGTLGTEITITDDNGVKTEIHTSCSNPIGIGSVFGNYTVLSGASLKGGELCPVGELGDDDGRSGHRKYKKSHYKDHKRSHKHCDKKSHKKHHKKKCKKH